MENLEHPEITRICREGLPAAPEVYCDLCGEEIEGWQGVVYWVGDVVMCEDCMMQMARDLLEDKPWLRDPDVEFEPVYAAELLGAEMEVA